MSEKVIKIISKMIEKGASMQVYRNGKIMHGEGDKMWQAQVKKDAIESLETILANSVNREERALAREWRLQLKAELY